MADAVPFALALALIALPAGAEPMSPAEFEGFSENRTLIWAQDGVEYGVERYAPGRRVIWSDLTNTCRAGYWEAEGNEICFHYEYDEDDLPTCWTFSRDGDQVHADLTRDAQELRLSVLSLEGALICPQFLS